MMLAVTIIIAIIISLLVNLKSLTDTSGQKANRFNNKDDALLALVQTNMLKSTWKLN